MTASQRRKAIIDLLCMRKFETRENLAFEFGVSLRTIDYDILALTTEYPIYTTQGNGGGIHIDKEYKSYKDYLSSEQSELLHRLLPTLKGKDAEIMKSILSSFDYRNRRQ